MEFCKNLVLVRLLSSFFLLRKSKGEYCAPTTCPHDQTSIEFPFRIKEWQPKSCGSPGFDVSCDNQSNKTLLEIPSAGNFSIEDIDYCGQEIHLSDPDDCLPKKLLSLDLNNNIFRLPKQYEMLSWYNCSGKYWKYSIYDIIYCVSEDEYTVISTKFDVASYIPECTFLKNIPPFEYRYSILGRTRAVTTLAWDVLRSQRCDYSPSPPYHYPEDKSGWRIAVGFISAVVMGLGLPALAVLLCLCRKQQAQRNINRSATYNANTSTSTNTTTARGLDQNIIDLYPVMIVGESGCPVASGDVMCPICLSDYVPRDKLKVLPECLHRFHAGCIDEWLRDKPTCPVCRITPPRTAPTF